MKKLIIIGVLFAFLVGCGGFSSDRTNQRNHNNANEQVEQEPAPVENTPTSGADCYGSETHPVGQSIAEQFEEETSYEQVMVWFCNGALFDDILTALQTERISNESAHDLLILQASGMTWEQIWLEIGLTEE